MDGGPVRGGPSSGDTDLDRDAWTLETLVFVTPNGSVQPEYVVVPDALLVKTKELKPFFDLSFAYEGCLKPKPTTRKKAR